MFVYRKTFYWTILLQSALGAARKLRFDPWMNIRIKLALTSSWSGCAKCQFTPELIFFSVQSELART